MTIRILFGVLIFGYALHLSYRIYRLFRYNDWSSPLFGIKVENPSRFQQIAFSLMMLPFIVFFYLFAFEIIFKVEIFGRFFPFLKWYKRIH